MITKAEKKRLRERLTARAEENKQLARLALRVSKILQRMGYAHKRDIWKNFDALMMYEIIDQSIRHEILKRVFSVRGARMMMDDERWVVIIENKVGISS